MFEKWNVTRLSGPSRQKQKEMREQEGQKEEGRPT